VARLYIQYLRNYMLRYIGNFSTIEELIPEHLTILSIKERFVETKRLAHNPSGC